MAFEPHGAGEIRDLRISTLRLNRPPGGGVLLADDPISGLVPTSGAGSSTAGAFLSNFVGEIPWAHLDIAGSAWGATDRDYQGGNVGTGVGVRLLVEYVERQA